MTSSAPEAVSVPAQVITGSSDSTVRVWDAKTCDCLTSFRPPGGAAGGGGERAVLGVALNPQNVDQLLVCTRSPALFTMTLQGQVRAAPAPLAPAFCLILDSVQPACSCANRRDM